MTTATASRGACRLLGSLLPATWPSRSQVLESAARVDAAHAGDGSDALLAAWRAWRHAGELPANASMRDLLAALGLLLGGIATEMRFRPRRYLRPEAAA